MFHSILARLRQGHRTLSYPKQPVPLPERFRGYPRLQSELCPEGCSACCEACPSGALQCSPGLAVDLGRCLFCPECVRACPQGAIEFLNDGVLAVNRREELVVREGEPRRTARPLQKDLLKLFRRSLKFRSVVAGGCNACEADTNVLNTIGWDVGRFGIQFVASPRHADGLWVTGPVTRAMHSALLETYQAIPAPKIVVACGACAISGGPFMGSPEAHDGLEGILPVDLYIPGCPPHPLTIMDGLLRLLDKLPQGLDSNRSESNGTWICADAGD